MSITETLNKRPVGDIKDEDARMTAKSLNVLLANEFALFTKTLNYHWNITGPRFHSLHSFLETQYQNLLPVMDNIAERIRVLGETPVGTVEGLNEKMNVQEFNGGSLSSNQMLKDLYTTNMMIQTTIKDLATQDHLKHDPGTEDFLIGLLQKHENLSWMIKSHLD